MATESIPTTLRGSTPIQGIETVKRPPASPKTSSLPPITSKIKTAAEPIERNAEDAEREVTRAIETVEMMMDIHNRSVLFLVDEESGADVIKVVDGNSGEIIRQMPTDELLGFMRNLTNMLGNFVDEMV
jgi:flagellar protein FlaG|tara:strand:- start:1720 stop:2106 length:387 start_codon:yes stop_codon:yes gene_type:complete